MASSKPGLRDTSYCSEPLRPYFTQVFNAHLEAWQQAPREFGKRKRTQQDFCEQTGYSIDALRNWRSGESLPGRAALPSIFQTFGTTPEEFSTEVNNLFLKDWMLDQLLDKQHEVHYPTNFPNAETVIRATWQYMRTIFSPSMSDFPLQGGSKEAELDKDGYYQWSNGPTWEDPLPEGVNIPTGADFNDFYAVVDNDGYIHELYGSDFEFLTEISQEVFEYIKLRIFERKQALNEMLTEGNDKNRVCTPNPDVSDEYEQMYGKLNMDDWSEIARQVKARHVSYVVRDENGILKTYKSAGVSDKLTWFPQPNK